MMSILMLRRQQSGVPIVQSGLVVYYRFDEASGQVVTDHSGGGHDGMLGSTAGADTNDPSWAAEGLDFTTDDFVSTANEFGAFVLEWPVSGEPPPDPEPQLLDDPGQGLTPEAAWSARDVAWRTSDPAEREQLLLERVFAWRMRSLGRS